MTVDDTGFAKKGLHSVGVARQYCGRLGKQDNYQIAVTLSVANHAASPPIAYLLYLPEAWAMDAARRRKAGVPEDVVFKTKPQIALDQIRAAVAAGALQTTEAVEQRGHRMPSGQRYARIIEKHLGHRSTRSG